MFREDNAMAVHNVYRWVEMFYDRRPSMHDDARNGRLSNTVNDSIVNIMRTLLDEDWHYTLDNLYHKIVTQYMLLVLKRRVDSHNTPISW